MICVGNTFLIKTPPNHVTEHLYIVMAIDSDKVLLVNIESNSFDVSCPLNKSDHPFLTHKSYINYKDTLLADISSIEAALCGHVITPHIDASPNLLRKIKNGAKISPNLKKGYLPYFS